MVKTVNFTACGFYYNLKLPKIKKKPIPKAPVLPKSSRFNPLSDHPAPHDYFEMFFAEPQSWTVRSDSTRKLLKLPQAISTQIASLHLLPATVPSSEILNTSGSQENLRI